MPLSLPVAGLGLKGDFFLEVCRSGEGSVGALWKGWPVFHQGWKRAGKVPASTQDLVSLGFTPAYLSHKPTTPEGARNLRSLQLLRNKFMTDDEGSFSESYERRCDRHKGHFRSKRTTGLKSHAASKKGSHAGSRCLYSSGSPCLSQDCWSFVCGILAYTYIRL